MGQSAFCVWNVLGIVRWMRCRKRAVFKSINSAWIIHNTYDGMRVWSSVRLAFLNACRKTEDVKRPKELGDIRGISYIYPLLWRFGVITVPENTAKKMEIR